MKKKKMKIDSSIKLTDCKCWKSPVVDKYNNIDFKRLLLKYNIIREVEWQRKDKNNSIIV